MRKYSRKELRERERLGYSRISAGRQCCYIIKQAAAAKLRAFAPALSYGLREAKAVSVVAYGANISAIAAPILITIRSKSYERQYFTRY